MTKKRYCARRGTFKSITSGSLWFLSIGSTRRKNTVCLLLRLWPPGINPELTIECKLIAHPTWYMYWKKPLGITTLSCKVGSIRLRPEWPWRSRRYKIIPDESVQYWYLFLFPPPFAIVLFHFSSSQEEKQDDRREDRQEEEEREKWWRIKHTTWAHEDDAWDDVKCALRTPNLSLSHACACHQMWINEKMWRVKCAVHTLWFWVVFPRTATIRSHKSSAGIPSSLNPASKEMISDSVELCETEVCFLHIQLIGTNVWLPKTQCSTRSRFWILKISCKVGVLKQSQSALSCSVSHITILFILTRVMDVI